MLKSMTLQLFPSFPPLQAVPATTRTLVGGGHLIQRELVDISGLGRLARERSLAAPDRETLERWDHDGLFSPMVFVTADGPTGSWRTTEPYPTDGLHFRDEHPYVPWEQLTAQLYERRVTRPLYSPWQVMYLGTAREFDGVEVYIDAMLEGGERLVTWAADHSAFVEQHAGWRGRWHALWLPLVKLLTRVQSRHWPFIKGRSVLLIDPASSDYVDAVDLEYERSTPVHVRAELGASYDELRVTYEWLAQRWKALDPAPDLYPLLRLEPRVRRERRKGVALQALDFQDAAGILRRFLRELDGRLPPDLDQLDDPDAEPRPVRRDRSQLQEALREADLYPHRLHIIVEGATEERLIRRLFLAFAGPWEGSGLAITDLGGDKLKGSRTMLEGFGVYADAVALLLDDENEARRVTEQLAHGGVLVGDHVKLWKRSLEEDNFTPDELLTMVAQLAAAAGAQLTHLGGPRTRQQTAALLEHDVQHWELHGFGAWIFVSKHTGEMVGRGGLKRTNVGGRESVEVSYAVASALWGRGYATEMARAAADAAMRLGLPEIVAFTLTTNQASQCVLAKIGVRPSATCSTRDYHTGSADAPFPLRSSPRSLSKKSGSVRRG